MSIWTVCLHAVLLSGLAQPPGTPPGSPPGSAASGSPSSTATSAPSQAEVPLGLHVFAVALLGAITTVLVYPTRRTQS